MPLAHSGVEVSGWFTLDRSLSSTSPGFTLVSARFNMADLEAAVEARYTTHLAFLPDKRTNYNSISDLASVPANKIKKLKVRSHVCPLVCQE